MKDSPSTILMQAVQTAKTHVLEELHKMLGRLTPRQRLFLVVGLFTLFVAVDVYYIVSGFAGKGNKPLDVQHIESIDIHPEKLSEYDSSR